MVPHSAAKNTITPVQRQIIHNLIMDQKHFIVHSTYIHNKERFKKVHMFDIVFRSLRYFWP